MTRTRTRPFAAARSVASSTLAVAISTLAVATSPLAAQTPTGERIGHIVAIVGDSAVLNFDIQDGMLAWQSQTRQQVPPSGPEYDRLYEQILQQKVSELLLVQAALRDTTVKVVDAQIERAAQQQIEDNQRAVGGLAQLEMALAESGLTLATYRERLTAQLRKRALIQQYIARVRLERKAPPVTDRDLREAFDLMAAQLGVRPATVTFQQILIRSTPSDSALAKARMKADSILRLIQQGEDFDEMARRFGEDATRERGGDLGWIRRNDVVRDFAAVAFNLRPGEVSQPVRTQHGYHIIKVERTRGAEAQVRHILIRPELTSDDALRARARADTVADQLRAGADANELAQRYGDRDEQLRWGPSEVDSVQARLGVDMSAVGVGDVIGPLPMGGDEIASEFLVLKVIEREAERPWSIDDALLRENLRRRVEDDKLEREIVADLRRSMYVEIRRS